MNRPLPGRLGRSQLPRGRLVSVTRMLAVNDVVLFGQRNAVGIRNFVAHQNENQRARPALFETNVSDPGSSMNPLPHMQRMMKLQAPSCPHAARQIDRRKEPSASGVAIRTQFRLPVNRQEIKPVPQRRKRIAGLRPWLVDIERRGKRGNRRRGDFIGKLFGPADPVL
jgi:hypothetical protein